MTTTTMAPKDRGGTERDRASDEHADSAMARVVMVVFCRVSYFLFLFFADL